MKIEYSNMLANGDLGVKAGLKNLPMSELIAIRFAIHKFFGFPRDNQYYEKNEKLLAAIKDECRRRIIESEE